MIVRIVRMTLRPESVDSFMTMFDEIHERIVRQPGCLRLDLVADTRYTNIVTTLSWWDSESSLEAYRAGELFRTTWARTKPLFAAPAEAWSHTPLRSRTSD